MSLFGSSQDQSTLAESKPSRSLFDDNGPPKRPTSGASLFADEADGGGDSPWNFPVAKKGSQRDLVKKLLSASSVPDTYVDAFDTILESGARQGSGISADAVTKVLQASKIYSAEQSRLQNLVAPNLATTGSLGRAEFNVLLALIGLAQEGEEASLDGVDERRKNLPRFSIPYLQRLKSAKVSETLEDTTSQSTATTPAAEYPPSSTPSKSRRFRKDSLDDPEADPWASPAPNKNTTLPVNDDNGSKPTTVARPTSNGYRGANRTTSAFTTHSIDPGSSSSTLGADAPGGDATIPGWGSYDDDGSSFPNGDQSGLGSSDLGNAGFGSGDGSERNPNPTVSQSLGRSKTTSRGVEEIVNISVLPEKEGMFMFQHRNYEVKSARRASTVIRRYSDFVWLLDCLHKRYPFRQLPLLPPKRVAVNGRHLSSDVTFIEKRRRGLVRFSNALVRHPALSQEQLVVMFLTVPTELAVWRKQATISVQEEFVGKSLPPGLEDSLPLNLQDTFDTVRSGVKRSSETYIGLCNLLERLTKRNQGLASDYLRFSTSLQGLLEDSPNTYATDTNDVPLLNEGISSAARHMETSQSLLEDEARAWDEGILEDLKRQRDTLVGVRDMFDRRDRYARDNIPQLERRIEANENKLAGIRARPEGAVKPGEAQKVEEAIMSDKQSIVNQHARGVFIKECIRDELVFFQTSQYHVSRMHQDWSQERVKYAELQADNWRAFSEEVENMPIGD